MTSSAEHRRNLVELNGFADLYPYAAVTSTSVKVEQHWKDKSVSRETGRDVRTWRFKSRVDRDMFCNVVPSAEPAGGPR